MTAQTFECVAVIPAYNEARSIRDVVVRTLAQLPQTIVVDDGSQDGTSAAIAGLPVVLLRNDANLGKAASLWRGMQHALDRGADAIVTLDGDGQHEPEDITRFVEAARLHPGAIIVGARLHARHAIPRQRYLANRFANFWIAWAAGQPIADSQCGFRLYPASVLRQLRIPHDKRDSFVFESEVLIEAGRRGVPIVAVPIEAIYDAHARPSHFQPLADVGHIARMISVKLLGRCMDLRGLVRSRSGTPLVCASIPRCSSRDLSSQKSSYADDTASAKNIAPER